MKVTRVAAIAALVCFFNSASAAMQSSANFRVDVDAVTSGIGDANSVSFVNESTVSGPGAQGNATSTSYRLIAGYQGALTGAFYATFITKVNSTVAGYYQSILGRPADGSGLAFWSGEASRVTNLGPSVREVFFALSITFFTSPEYTSKNNTNNQYITNLYRTFFVREPDSAGLAFWGGYLTQGVDRGALLANFLFSQEFSGFMTSVFGPANVRPEVDMAIDFFRGILGRLPDDSGFGYWLSQLRTAQCQGASQVTARISELAQLFTESGEYQARESARPVSDRARMHIGDLYNAFLRRGAEPVGYNFWVGQITSGAQTRSQVRSAFVNSPEFQSRVNAVINAGCLNP